MERYKRALDNLKKKFGCEWIKPAAEAVIEVALQDYYAGNLTSAEYTDICVIYAEIIHPKNRERI